MNEQKSKCCGAEVEVYDNWKTTHDRDNEHYSFICSKCGNPCEIEEQKQSWKEIFDKDYTELSYFGPNEFIQITGAYEEVIKFIFQEINKAREEGRQMRYQQGKAQNESEILSAIQLLNKILNK